MACNVLRISFILEDNKQEMKIDKGGPTNFAGLETLRLSDKFFDVTLRVVTSNIRAHKVVLVAHSLSILLAEIY